MLNILLTCFHCRLDLSEDSVREKERYEAREREEVVRKQKEKQMILKVDRSHYTDCGGLKVSSN